VSPTSTGLNLNIAPVVCGGYVNGYSIARSFHDAFGLKSVLADSRRSLATYSNLCSFAKVADPKIDETRFLEDMRRLIDSLIYAGKHPFIFVTGDDWLIPLAKYQVSFPRKATFSFPGWDSIRHLIEKQSLYRLADSVGVPYPPAVSVRGTSFPGLSSLRPPVIVKPSLPAEFLKYRPGEPRNNIFSTIDDARSFLDDKFTHGYPGEFIVQEQIPGPIENLYTISTFSDRHGVVRGVSTGCKLHQSPPRAGTIKVGLVRFEPRIIDPCLRLLKRAGFFGVANTEFKLDPRDNEFKLIEVNPRPGMWNYSCLRSGTNFFRLALLNLVLGEEVAYEEGRIPLVWSVLPRSELPGILAQSSHEVEANELIRRGSLIDPLDRPGDALGFRSRVFFHRMKPRVHRLVHRRIKVQLERRAERPI